MSFDHTLYTQLLSVVKQTVLPWMCTAIYSWTTAQEHLEALYFRKHRALSFHLIFITQQRIWLPPAACPVNEIQKLHCTELREVRYLYLVMVSIQNAL